MGHYVAAVAVVLVMSTSTLYAQDAQFVVTATSADVHRTPSTGSAVIGKAPRGKSLEVVRELGSWVRVAWPEAQDGVGYIHVAWGQLSHGASIQAPPPTNVDTPLTRFTFESDSPTVAAQIPQEPGPGTSAPSPTRVTRPAPLLPSHIIGLGGRVGTQIVGAAAAARAWTRGPLGFQVEVGRSIHTRELGGDLVRSMQLTPGVIYSLPNLVTNAIWSRPYIGAGVNVYRATLISEAGFPSVAENGLGAQILGGAEFTWANVPQFGLSADLRHQWAPDTFDGFELSGTAFSVSAHWYVK